MFLLRLDDACEYRDQAQWARMETLLDRYGIQPLVGVIPLCRDPDFLGYPKDDAFAECVKRWKDKGWTFALHGYEHVINNDSDGGINPVNRRSEFVGLPLEEQERKIRDGLALLRKLSIEPKVFFAPFHTFDENTLTALKNNGITIVSDTVANKPYSFRGITFVPQQSGSVRKLPFSVVTFCYHPNTMKDEDFDRLEVFLKANRDSFSPFPCVPVTRKKSLYDRFLSFLYFLKR